MSWGSTRQSAHAIAAAGTAFVSCGQEGCEGGDSDQADTENVLCYAAAADLRQLRRRAILRHREIREIGCDVGADQWSWPGRRRPWSMSPPSLTVTLPFNLRPLSKIRSWVEESIDSCCPNRFRQALGSHVENQIRLSSAPRIESVSHSSCGAINSFLRLERPCADSMHAVAYV